MWEAARVTIVAECEIAMEKLKGLNEKAWKHMIEDFKPSQ